MNVLLVANYRPDGQQSMLRAADLIEREFRSSRIEVLVIRPEPFFGRLIPKWRKNREMAGLSG